MPENPIYDFLKANKLTDKDEKTFLNEYSDSTKAKELFEFFKANQLTDKDFGSFYDTYLKKKEEPTVSGVGGMAAQVGVVGGVSAAQSTKKAEAPKKDEFADWLARGKKIDVTVDDPIADQKVAEQQRIWQAQTEGTKVDPLTRFQTIQQSRRNLKELENPFEGNVEAAKDYLSKKKGVSVLDAANIEQLVNPQNQTERAALNAIKNVENIQKAIASSPTIEDAAVQYQGSRNDIIGQQAKFLGKDIPNEIKGRWVQDFLRQPEVQKLAQFDPQFRAKIDEAQNTLYDKFPEFAINEVRRLIGQEREDRGRGGWFADNPSVAKTEELVQEMLKRGKTQSGETFGEKEYKIWNDYIKPTLSKVSRIGAGEEVIPSASLQSALRGGLEQGFGGIESTARQFAALSDTERRKKLTRDAILNEYKTVGVEPNSELKKTVNTAGHLVGFLAPMLMGGAAGSPHILTNFMVFAGGNADNAMRYFPNDEWKQAGYTLLSTGIDMTLADLLPIGKLTGVKKEVGSVIRNTINDFTEKRISAEAAKKTILDKVAEMVTKKAGQNLGTSATLTSFGIAHNTVDTIFGGRDMSFDDIAEDALKSFTTNFFAATPLTLMQRGNANLYGNTIRHIIENSEQYKPYLDKASPEIQNNFKLAQDVWSEIKDLPIKKSEKNKYFFDELQKQVIRQKAKEATTDIQKQELEKKAKDAELRQKLIENPDTPPIELIEQAEKSGLLDNTAKMMLYTDGKIDPEKVNGYLEFVAQQANNLTIDWKPESPDRPSLRERFPQSIVDLAEKVYAKEIEQAKIAEDKKWDEMTLEEKRKKAVENLPEIPTEEQAKEEKQAITDADEQARLGRARIMGEQISRPIELKLEQPKLEEKLPEETEIPEQQPEATPIEQPKAEETFPEGRQIPEENRPPNVVSLVKEGGTTVEKPAIEIPQTTKALADKVRNLKIDISKLSGGGLQSNPLGLPIAVWNGAMDIVAKTIEAGGEVVDAVKRGLNYIQKNHRGQWDKKGFNDQVMKELGVRGIRVNGEDLIVKSDPKTEREFAQTVNGWYSDLEQSVLDVKGEVGSGESWKKVLGNSDEAKWTGLNDWLSQQKGNVSKKDIQQYLKDNRIQIVEVVKGSQLEWSDAAQKDFEKVGIDFTTATSDEGEPVEKPFFYSIKTGEPLEIEDFNKAQRKVYDKHIGENTKFAQYQLEGQKENYKEVLVTLPKNKITFDGFEIPEKSVVIYEDRGMNKPPKVVKVINKSFVDGSSEASKFIRDNQWNREYNLDYQEGEDFIDHLKAKNLTKEKTDFESSHFDEPNILVHLRMNTRTDADGKKVLFLEEIQSDWGQKGKKEGFKKESVDNRLEEINGRIVYLENGVARGEFKRGDIIEEKSRLQRERDSLQSNIPSAPFVTETPSWTKLGLKVALKEAVKQGADKIAWTTGEQQNERYDLSKHVDEVGARIYSDGTYGIVGRKDGKAVFEDNTIPENKLADYVGKELAEKIIANASKEQKWQYYEGNDLKMGGKGMKGFYGEPSEGKLGIVGEVAKSLFKQDINKTKIEIDQPKLKVNEDELYINDKINPKVKMVAEKLIKEANEKLKTKLTPDQEFAERNILSQAHRLLEAYNENDPNIANVINTKSDYLIKQFDYYKEPITATQHSIEITPELKQEVEGGLPLFKDIKGRGKEIADALRKGKIKIDGLQSNVFGIPVAVWNAAVETIARAIEKGADLASAIKEAIDTHKLDKIKTFDRDKFIAGLEKATGEKLTEQGRKEPPPNAPTEPPIVEGIGEKPEKDLRDKAVLNRLVNAQKLPESIKEKLREEGLKYEPIGHQETADYAKGIIEEMGIDDAVLLAEAGKFKGGTNSAIFAESLNKLSESDKDAPKFAEIAIKYDNWAREMGRDISQIAYFYKKSPLGMVLYDNAKRREGFEEWSKSKDKDWKVFFDEMMKEPEFEQIFKEKLSAARKEERAKERATRIKKVDDFFDKAKDQFKGGAAYATIIPPKVIIAALEGMKKAYHAGEAVAKIVQDAIDYISDQLGHSNWDKDKFRAEWEAKLGGKEKEKKGLTDEELKQRLLDKFRKKLKGLTDKEKEEVVRRAFKKIVDAGGLDYADFKKIIADVTGRGELTPEQAEQLKDLVKKTNSVEEAAKKAQSERTPESIAEFEKAQIEAGKAARELSELLYNKPDVIKRLTTVIQLNTLTLASLVRNPAFNVINQSMVRFPVGLVNDAIDRAMYYAATLFGKNYTKEYNIWGNQLEFWRGLRLGTKESFEQLFTGLNRQDYIQKEVYGQQIRPVRAVRELIAAAKGKRKLSAREKIDKLIQATVGVPAEISARLLNMGDKPQRFAAERVVSSAFKDALGLKDMKSIDYKIFVLFPKEEAYRIYKEKGLSDAEAQLKAEYIEKAIIKEGERSTFQQDNLLNDLITRGFSVFGGKNTGIANLLKTVTVSPYIKIPSNAFWSGYNLLNPEVAMLQVGVYAGRAKLLASKGKEVDSKMAMREARYWLGHAFAGYAMRAVVLSLIGKGIFTPSTSPEDKKKEREGRLYFTQPGTINITKLWAAMRGQDPSKVEDGITITNNWFGQFGYMGDAIARREQDMTEEQKKNLGDFWDIVWGGMEAKGLEDVQNGIFGNTSALLNSLSGNDNNRYLLGITGMFMNIVHPATLAQMSKSELPYYSTTGGDGFLKQLENAVLQRSSVIRKLSGKYPPSRIDIWGQEMKRGGSVIQKMFGINKQNKDAFAKPIFDDMERTGDISFLPPAIPNKVAGKKLNDEQYNRIQTYIGGARKKVVAPYVNNGAEITVIGDKKYKDLNDSEKRDVLEYLYQIGYEEGMSKFLSDYPEFKKADPTIQDKIYEKRMDLVKKIIKIKSQKELKK